MMEFHTASCQKFADSLKLDPPFFLAHVITEKGNADNRVNVTKCSAEKSNPLLLDIVV